MKQDDAIAAAENYATAWDVPWGTITKTQKHRTWLTFTRGYTFAFESEFGIGEVDVWHPNEVMRCEFIPSDSRYHMLPLWAAFPTFNSVTIGWRMGYGEVYKYRWHDWYDQLPDEKRSEYKKRFPPPEDEELCWYDFYELLADDA